MGTQTSTESIAFADTDGGMGLVVRDVDLTEIPSEEVVDLYIAEAG